ncbi:hypothetical protein [Mycolicibacterium vaccae]|uniref:Uncharacterized protein n=1 Tax=Mycolicibacterium vaccae ATCC 25954 TaxID=1194972 RepID=K0V3J3_MYCVA|nr:hypothetical protein [Mycolicibacterium vaccae]EJZ05614.1 hypothetical protein MVAC_24740 [Mycolicibacterium vaccae ATCC 25954]
MPEPQDSTPRRLNEDWLAVIVGLTLLALVLVGAIPGSLIP